MAAGDISFATDGGGDVRKEGRKEARYSYSLLAESSWKDRRGFERPERLKSIKHSSMSSQVIDLQSKQGCKCNLTCLSASKRPSKLRLRLGSCRQEIRFLNINLRGFLPMLQTIEANAAVKHQGISRLDSHRTGCRVINDASVRKCRICPWDITP